MGITLSKKKRYLILLLGMLCLAGATAGIYLLINTKSHSGVNYKVNKYPETISWCDTNNSDGDLNVTCNALLLSILPSDTENSCADVEIITKDWKFEKLSVCEDTEKLTYSNEALNYKKLMPVEIKLSYKSDNSPNTFVLEKILVQKISEAFFENTLNEDIGNLSSIGKTEIQNSMDFCPSPSQIPQYVTEGNRTKYTEFYNQNILSEGKYTEIFDNEFKNAFLDNWTDPAINILFGCESSSRLGYHSVCKTTLNSEFKNLKLTSVPTFVSDIGDITNSESDLVGLKNLSLTLDGMGYIRPHSNYAAPIVTLNLFKYIYDANNNQNVYCSEYKIHQKLAQFSTDSKVQLDKMQAFVTTNISQASPICLDILDRKLYSKEGIYLKSLNWGNIDILTTYERCNNLYRLLSDE